MAPVDPICSSRLRRSRCRRPAATARTAAHHAPAGSIPLHTAPADRPDFAPGVSRTRDLESSRSPWSEIRPSNARMQATPAGALRVAVDFRRLEKTTANRLRASRRVAHEPGPLTAKKNGRTRRRGQVIREETPKRAGPLCAFAAAHASREFQRPRNKSPAIRQATRMTCPAGGTSTSFVSGMQRIPPVNDDFSSQINV